MRECYTGRLSNVRRADVFLQYLSAPILGHNDGHHRALGHPSGRSPRLPALPLALHPSARRRLPGRLSVPGGASPGPRWRTRHLARWSVPRAGPCAVRRRGLPPLSHPLLARCGRRHAAAARLGWRRPGALAYRRRRAGPRPPAPLDVLPVAQRRRPSLPLVPVGRAAARDRVAGGTVRARPARPQPDAGPGALALDALAAVVAVVPPHVPLRCHEARERRSGVAPSQRARLPLLDPTAPHLAGVVRAMDSRLAASSHYTRDPGPRAARSLAHFRARAMAPGAVCRLRAAGRGPARDRPYGKLRLFQPAGGRVVRAAARRRRSGARAAAAPRGHGTRAAVAVLRDPRRRAGAGAAPAPHVRPRDRANAAHLARGARQSAAPRRRAAALRERVRAVPRDDDGAPRDRHRG